MGHPQKPNIISREGRIFLIRHGKPEFPYTNEPGRWIWGREFNRLTRLYDESSLNPEWNNDKLDVHDPDLLGRIRASQAISSDIRRARQTASLLLGDDSPVDTNELFREVPLPRVPTFLKLPAYWHLILARLLWYAGKKSHEPRKAARRRAKKAADLIESYESRNPVSLFSHGFFLFLLTRELMNRGWHCEETRPMRYLEIRCLLRKSVLPGSHV
ncbi:MAG: histidine phosphatase family protein [Leptospiraceae bacterium]